MADLIGFSFTLLLLAASFCCGLIVGFLARDIWNIWDNERR